MSGVDILYNGSTKATMTSSGTKTLTTRGKFCDHNAQVKYTKPAAIKATVNATATAASSSIVFESVTHQPQAFLIRQSSAYTYEHPSSSSVKYYYIISILQTTSGTVTASSVGIASTNKTISFSNSGSNITATYDSSAQTFTVTSSVARTTAPGRFGGATYQLIYFYYN